MNVVMIADGKKIQAFNATVQAGIFPVLLIHSISKWKVLGLFMTVFSGKHVNFKEVELFEANRIENKYSEELYLKGRWADE